jgi:hypothetical protein
VKSPRQASGQGGGGIDYPAFYAYAYPAPGGFRGASVRPDAAFWHDGLSEFVLPYDAVQSAADPDAALMAFLVSSYEAAADLGGWDRDLLECMQGQPRRVRRQTLSGQGMPLHRALKQSSGTTAHRRGATGWSSMGRSRDDL